MSMKVKRTIRKYLYLSHLCVGLILGLYFSLLGLTGSTLIFKTELNLLFENKLHQVDIPANANRVPLDAIAETFKQATPGAKIASIVLPERADETIIIPYRSIQPNVPGGKRHDWRQCFINPYTGAIIGDEIGGGEFFHTIRNLHARLLLEDLGIDLNRYGVLFIIVLLVSGIWLWFPSINHFANKFKQRTTIKLDGKFKRIIFDMHNTFGFYSSGLLLTFAVTALTALWYDQSSAVVSFVSHSAVAAEKKSKPSDEEKIFSYDRVIESAKNSVPGYIPSVITDSMHVLMAPANNHFFFPRMVTLILNEKTYAIDSIERPEDKPFGQQIMNWAMPIHFGQFGYGFAYYPVKLLWLIAGFCPLILCVTGFLMYFEKQKTAKKHLQKHLQRQAQKQHSVCHEDVRAGT